MRARWPEIVIAISIAALAIVGALGLFGDQIGAALGGHEATVEQPHVPRIGKRAL
jgi:hypothetical protein